MYSLPTHLPMSSLRAKVMSWRTARVCLSALLLATGSFLVPPGSSSSLLLELLRGLNGVTQFKCSTHLAHSQCSQKSALPLMLLLVTMMMKMSSFSLSFFLIAMTLIFRCTLESCGSFYCSQSPGQSKLTLCRWSQALVIF